VLEDEVAEAVALGVSFAHQVLHQPLYPSVTWANPWIGRKGIA